MTTVFDEAELKKLFKPPFNSSKNQNGLVTVIGGSNLFHGAPLLALITASRIVDMVFFTSPEPSIGEVASHIKSSLFSFIWVPWNEKEEYIKKSDSVLIGPGFMRYRSENTRTEGTTHDDAWRQTKEITQDLLLKFSEKRWVIDAGSLQTLEPEWIPGNAILTPNQREYKMLFGDLDPNEASKKYNCIIVVKGPTTNVYSPDRTTEIKGGNPGLTKGGSGDVQAGLTVALLTKNEPFLAACSGALIEKRAADELYKSVGVFYNSDDLARKVPETLHLLTK